jgi:hopanoid biosynthesis associated RND transporter like protein HpnN
MSLLLETPVLGGLDPLFGWRSLTVQQLLDAGKRKVQVWDPTRGGPETEQFLRQLSAVCRSAADYLHDDRTYRTPWRSVVPAAPGQDDLMAEPQYFFGGDGTLASLLVRPVKEKEGFTYSQKSIDALRALLDAVRPRHPGVEFGLTGLPVLENDEMLASQNDSNTASWLALAGVALLYLVVYRGLRYPLMTIATLLVGTAWALGWLTLTVGHLNILSSAFAVMLIGMGDYGVLWVTRFGQERQAGADMHDAMCRTARHVGPSIVTAALTTSLAFFAAMLADLKAVSELGWIAGSGVLLCALSCFVVMPALLSIFDFRPKRPDDADGVPILSLEDHRAATREWLPGLMRRPGWVLAGSVLATGVLGYCALGIDYDHNLLHLQAGHLESVRWEKTLIEQTAGTSWHALSSTTTPEEALALKAKYERLPDVSRVVEVASLIPRDQDRKRELLADVQRRLKVLPPRGGVVEHAVPSLDDLHRVGTRVLDALAGVPNPPPVVAELRESLTRLLRQARAVAKEDGAGYRLKMYEELLTRDLAEDLHKLRDVSTPAPIRLADLPTSLRERYVGRNGRWLLRVFSKDCLWEFEPLSRFIAQVRTVDPEATGKPFTTLEGLKAMQNGFLWAGVYALAAMVLVLLIDFGTVQHTLLALLPLGMGMVATLGVMALFGCPLNPANMIAFPLILGVGADNGVHVLHDYRERDRRQRYRLGRATGRGITVAALTTILGFGTLMAARHRGMASLGLALAVGVTCCMATALVFLPALLGVVGKRKPAMPETATETERRAA